MRIDPDQFFALYGEVSRIREAIEELNRKTAELAEKVKELEEKGTP